MSRLTFFMSFFEGGAMNREIPKYFKNYLAKPDETLFEHTNNLIEKLNKLDELHKIPYKDLIELACLYHDIGKINPLFSKRVSSDEKFDDKEEIGHNILSFFLFYYLNEALHLGAEDMKIVAYAILNHHSYVENFDVIKENISLIEKNLELILSGRDGENFTVIRLRRVIDDIGEFHNKMLKKVILVKGFLHKCDYSASAYTEIEYGGYDIKERLAKLNYTWNPMQNFAYENRERNMIIVGSTGLGKTEAALRWIDNNKGFYVLPLRTAINSMFLRLKNGLYKEDYLEKIALLHGEAKSVFLNQMAEEKKNMKEPTEDGKVWDYLEVSKTMALPLTITTPDQLFSFVFKYPGYELLLATLSYSKVVIDEIQAYNSRVLAFLIYGMQNIVKMGGKISIITATLAPFIRDLMNVSFDENMNRTKFGFDFQEARFMKDEPRHHVSVLNKMLDKEDIVNFVRNHENSETMKILVVMNTVQGAQKLYHELNERIGEEVEIKVLHARYILRDRNQKEKKILADGGRFVKKKMIWIATQVVEASLDIDFDYLFTEFSDLNSFFQRIGRVNRAALKPLTEVNVFVYLAIEEKCLSEDFIDKTLYELGVKALLEWSETSDGILKEEDKLLLIDTYYTTENMKNSDFLRNYDKFFKEISGLQPNSLSKEVVNRLFRDIFSMKAIPKPVYDEKKEEIQEINFCIRKTKKRVLDLRKKLKNLQERIEREGLQSEIKREKIRLVELKNVINQYCVNLGYFKGMNLSAKEKIGGEELLIARGNYSEEVGFYPEDEKKDVGIFW